MTYRDDALAALDVAAFMRARGIELLNKVGGKEVRFLCPFHGDKEPSANVNLQSGLWHCKACGASGGPIDLVMKQDSASYKEALTVVGQLAGLPPPSLAVERATNGAAGEAHPASATKTKLTETNVKAWFEAGQRNAELQAWFAEHRGYTPETIEARQLGWDGQRVTIPVRDAAGKLLNVRRYLRNSTAEYGKMKPLVPGEAATQLFPLVDPLPAEVILVEGEWDAMLMHQEGFTNTLTVTAGTGIWKPHFTPLFENRTVTLIPDNDEPGRKGAAKLAAILANATPAVFICHIPNLPEKGDVTDFFVDKQRTADELRSLIADATPYVVAPTAVDEGEATRMPLHKASDAAFRGTRLELPVLLSGKAMTPYTVPHKFRVTCDMNNKQYCAVCPMQAANGSKEVQLAASDPAVLSLIGVSTQAQMTAIKALAKAVPQCNRPQIEIESSINIEELRLIPELDAGQGEEIEYVSRQGFFLGHGLLPNRSYAMRGYTHPHPKNQATVHLLSEAEPAQDNISAFAMTPELDEQLRVFQSEGLVSQRFEAIYDDFAAGVHRILDRFDMQVAFDLAWHSVIGFYFNGAFVRRGWVEIMVMGDSGQGKTEMAESLLRHYGLGSRLPGEQTSMAGLIGGLEKMGDTWMLGWGAIPLNDKRLLIIDEAQGLHPTAIEGMSDVRATGVAEITKIRTERTNARCRLVWMANPASGLTLAQHNQGVLAIKELFKKPEDVRRLDAAIAVASGDVDVTQINARHDGASEPRYRSDLCRSLVLWAWSRRPDQVTFTPEATDAILAAATDQGRRYHASIPLVEPSDQRLKLARLSAAAAARVYSTEDGEQLIVRREHVTFVVDFLERSYSSPSMAYDEYSGAMARGEQLDDEEEQLVRHEIDEWASKDEAIEFFRTTQVFKKVDLVDGLGWDDSYAKAQIRFLQGRRLIRPTRTGYYKSVAFITLLRALTGGKPVNDESLPDYEGAPF